MAKGYQANQERLAAISLLGKELGKRAGFCCEWCGGKEELRPWDSDPDAEPELAGLALLCGHCRGLAAGQPADPRELQALRTVLWGEVPAVVAGAARVLLASRQPWAREAIDEAVQDEALKAALLEGR